jgi:tetratricopeptide (TPR) repeat protein
LADAGEQHAIMQSHAEHYVQQAERLDAVRLAADWPGWRRQAWPWLVAEHDNIRAVLGRCRDGSVDAAGEAELGLRLSYSVFWFWMFRSLGTAESWHWLVSLLEATPARVSPARFWSTWAAGLCGMIQSIFDRSELLLREALELAQTLGDEQMIGLAEAAVGEDLLHRGRLAEAAESCERALSRARRVGPRCYYPILLDNVGRVSLLQGRVDRAAKFFDEAIAAARAIGDPWLEVRALTFRASASLARRDLADARTYLQQAEPLAQEEPDLWTGLVPLMFGQLALLEGNTREAARQFRRVLQAETVQYLRHHIALESLRGIALVLAARGEGRAAVRLLSAVDKAQATIKTRIFPDQQARVDATLVQLRHSEDFDTAWEAGQHLSLDEAIATGRDVATPEAWGNGQEQDVSETASETIRPN